MPTSPWIRFAAPAAILLVLIGMIGCRSFAPNAGHEIVLVKKPIFFGHGGVDPNPIRTGRTYGAISTDGIDVNMQPQKFEIELPDTMTKDGVPITFHAIMALRITDSVVLIRNFGPDWYSNNLEEPFKTMVRQAVRKRGMNETAISTTALDEIDNEIHDQLLSFMKAKSLPVELVTMTVGRANPPDSVKNQRIETATQEQRIQTEQQKKLAVAYMPYKVHVHRIFTDLTHAWVKGYQRNVFVRDFWRYVDVDMDEKQRRIGR